MSMRSLTSRLSAAAVSVTVIATLTTVGVAAAAAGPGDLDPTWSGDGRADKVLGTFSGGHDVIEDAEGRVITVGIFTSTPSFVVTRFDVDGEPDTTFGSLDPEGVPTGSKVINYGTTVLEAYAAVQSDGKIIVSGRVRTASGQHRIVIGRLNEDGTEDLTFGEVDPDGVPGPRLGRTFAGVGNVDPAFPTGGRVTLQPNGLGDRILIAGSTLPATTSYPLMFLARLDSNGSRDLSFGGGDAIAFVNFGKRSINQDVAVDPNTGDIVLSGLTGTAFGGENAALARFDANGALYGTGQGPWGQGTLVVNQAAARDDHAASVAIDSDGDIAITGGVFTGPNEGALTLLRSNGARATEFGTNGTFRNVDFFSVGATSSKTSAVAFDGNGNLLVAGTRESRGAIARFNDVASSDPRDVSFSGNGSAESICPQASAGSGVAVDSSGKYLLSGSCSTNTVEVYRFLSELEPIDSAIEITAVSADPSSAGARRLGLPIDDIDRTALAQFGSSLQSTPLRNTPLRNTPLRNTPLRNTPLRNTPLRNTPLRNTTIPILLSDIPLDREGGWEAVLAETTLAGRLPQNVTIQELLALSPAPPVLDDLTMDLVNLSATPLRNTSITATLLGLAPLSVLPAPGAAAGDHQAWCSYLAGQPLSCSNGVTPSTTITDLEIAGDDLADFHAQALPSDVLQNLPADAPLKEVHLADMSLADLPNQDLVTSALPQATAAVFFTCGHSCNPVVDLAQAQASDQLDPAATIDDLLVHRAQTGFEPTLADLIVALVPADDFPYESIPITELYRAARAPDHLVTYEVDLALACNPGESVRVVATLPSGADGGPSESTTYRDLEGAPLATTSSSGLESVIASTGEPCTASATSVDLVFTASGSAALGIDDISIEANVIASDGGGDPVAIVTDNESGAVVDATDAAEPDATEPPQVTHDVIYTGHIGSAGDVDIFSLPAPPVATEVSVILSHLPADYDLVLYGPDVVSAPLRNTPLRNTPLRNTPVEDDGLDPAGNILVPETLEDIPLRNTPLRNTSINRSTTDERVGTTIDESDQGSNLTIQVSGYDGATSPLPYMLRVKFDDGAPDLPCITRSYTGAGTPGTLPASVPPGTETLILVNQERLGQVYATTPAGSADVTELIGKLDTLAARADVDGVVVPVEGDPAVAAAYDAWDGDPCSVDAANDVVDAINALVDELRAGVTGLKHIVLIGADELLPQARLRDQVELSSQSDYRYDAALGGFDNPISRAFARDFFLSDEPFGDFNTADRQPDAGDAPFDSDAFYLADVGIGRLVETPEEISASIQRFIDSNGALDLRANFTAGYDFLKDAATLVDGSLRSRQGTLPSPQSRIDDTWTAEDIVDAWDDPSDPRAVSVNGHYDHFRALPAADDPATPGHDLLLSSQLLASSLPSGAFLFSMGCQGGLNIADVLVPLGPSGAPATETQDWAQVVAQKQGSLVGNTGFGYGDSEFVLYSERVYAALAARLDGTATVGQALALAKNGVVGDLGVPGVYDAKALGEATLYGLPMFRVGTTGQSAPSFVPEPTPVTPPTVTTQAVPFDFDFDFDADPESTGSGDYFQLPGEPAVGTHYRPVEPAHTTDLTPVPGKRAHGVLITELASTDLANFDPLLVRPIIDLGANEPKHTNKEVIFPTTLSNLTRTGTAAGQVDKLVLLTGQFFSDSSPANGGTQRLFTHMAGQVLHSNDFDDYTPPTINRVNAVVANGNGLFSVVTTTDADRVFVLFRDNGSPTWKPLDLIQSAPGVWSASAKLTAGATEITEWFVQTHDSARNVGISTNKGRYYEGVEVAALPPGLSVTPEASDSGFYPDGTVVTLEGAPGVASASVDGGSFEANDGSVTLHGDGVHTVVFRVNGEDLMATIPIDAGDPIVDVTYPEDGATLSPSSSSTPVFTCSDGGSGITSCSANPPTLDLTPGAHTVIVTGIDELGNETAVARDYTVADEGRTVVFTSTRDGNSEIYSMRPDGTDVLRLTNHSAIDTDPVWSPDKSKIAFSSTRHGNVEVYVMNADGSGVTRLTSHSRIDLPGSWSPDGSRIAFTSTRHGNSEIYTMSAIDGSGIVRLTTHSKTDSTPTFSPDGSTIAFTSTRGGNSDIYSMNAIDGSGVLQLTTHSKTDANGSWSSTGKIAFTSTRHGNVEIYSMNPDGSGIVRLTTHPKIDTTPRWSPDGSMLVFSSDRDGNFELYTVNADATDVLRRTVHSALDTLPDW
jgi:uncharacterized delta-60 repeat protein